MGWRRNARIAEVEALRELENERAFELKAGLVADLEALSAQELGHLAMEHIVAGEQQEWIGRGTLYYAKAAALSNLAILKTLSENAAPAQIETQA